MGELIITFSCILDCIMANPQNQNFVMTTEMVETFLKDLFGGDDCPFSKGVCNINLNKSLEEIFGENPINPEDAMFTLMDGEYLQDQGLLMILRNQKELIIKQEVVDSVFMAFAKLATAKHQTHEEIPDLQEDANAAMKE